MADPARQHHRRGEVITASIQSRGDAAIFCLMVSETFCRARPRAKVLNCFAPRRASLKRVNSAGVSRPLTLTKRR
jgi:hypothetical protein